MVVTSGTAVRGASALFFRNALVARRTLPVMVSGFFEPLFYLLSVGLGLGAALGQMDVAPGVAVSYAEFVAPAMLAVSAMNGALFDSTINIMWKLRYQKVYRTMAVTPVGAPDIVLGEIAWAQVRGTAYAASFLALMAMFGAVGSWWALLALPAAVLVGIAFGAVGMAIATAMRGWQDNEFVTAAQLALFLFSGTFFPLSVYPEPVRFLVELTPLYHAVELIRGLCVGHLTPALAGHTAYLVAMTVLGFAVTARRFGRFLQG